MPTTTKRQTIESNKTQTQQIHFVNTSINSVLKDSLCRSEKGTTSYFHQNVIQKLTEIEFGKMRIACLTLALPFTSEFHVF